MLKFQPRLKLIPQTKCGEIFCDSLKDFTIYCTFCEMKSFQFNDFLFHVQNVHLKNDFEETVAGESKELNYVQLSVKDKTILDEKEKGELWNMRKTSQSTSESLEIKVKNEDILNPIENEFPLLTGSESDSCNSWKKEKVRVLRKPRNAKSTRKPGMQNDHNDAEELKNEQKLYLKDATHTSAKSTKKSKQTEYTCVECQEKFLQKKHLDQHVRDLHNGYKCSLCDKRFNRTSHVEYHLKTHTTEKKFVCPTTNCGRGFIDEEYLKRHLEVHTMDRSFICKYDNCGKAFQTHRRLASHEYNHRIPKKFICDMCGYSCRSNPQLITHQRVHTGEKPFPCEVCSKPFISKIALQEHMISHSAKRPHICSICNKAFANRRVLVRHTYIHSDEKTFKCKLCESAFKHPNSLQGHMRHVHREPKLKSS